ncbi:RICIN domain-containing protein [Streptomyces sp. NPDC127084]|uniref:RICIN domain-containing protein n=1 Tax=Streptomyces sp. NPDC127084 TaxID=3347133 RepID=UPI0036548712
MPQQDDSTATPSPAVRRASVLPAVAAAPGSPPQGLLAAAGRPEPSSSEVTGTAAPAAGTATAAASAATGAGTAPAAALAVSGEPTASAGPGGETAPEGTPARAALLPGTSGRAHHVPEAPPQAASGSAAPPTVPVASAASCHPADPEGGRTAADGDEPSNGRPGKPLLAAAAIAGAVLVGVPFLLLGTGADDEPPAGAGRAQPVGGTLLEDGGSDTAPGSDGYAASPSVPPEKTVTAPGARPAKETQAVPGPRSTPTTPGASAPGSPNRAEKAAAPARRTATGRTLPQGADFRTTTKVLIKNAMTGLCVDVPNYGKGTLDGPVNQYTCDRTGDNQLWDLVVAKDDAGPVGADLFTIRNSVDGYCLDLPYYGGRAAGTPVSEWHCNGTTADNQLWYLDKKSEGKFWIRNHSSGNRCLDVSGFNGSGGKDARLTIFDCGLKDDHLWSFS